MGSSTHPASVRRRGLTSLIALLLSIGFQFPLATVAAPVPVLAAGALADVYVAVTGDDASDGTTAETAVATIARGIELAASGGTVHVGQGTYHEHNLAIDKALILIGDPGDATPGPGADAPVIDGDGLDIPNGSDDGFVIGDGVDDVTISGFEITDLYNAEDNDGTGVAVQGYGRGAKSNITISDNYFHDVGYGVLSGSDPWYDNTTNTAWTVERNVVAGFVIGIELSNTSNSIARDNILHMTDGTSGGVTHHAVTALWTYAWTSQTGVTYSGNTIDGALHPTYTATAYPNGGYPALLVWARNYGVTLSNLTIEHNDFRGVTGVAPRISLLDTATGHVTTATIDSNAFAADASALTTAAIGSAGSPVAGLVDASDDWWGQPSGPTAGQVMGAATTDPWIAAYTDDPTRTGDPGFWPLDTSLTAPLPTGTGVAEEFTDPGTGLHVDVTFDDITTGGTLSLEPLTSVPDPTGFQLGDPGIYFDLVAGGDLAFQDHVVVCIAVPSALADLHLYHHGIGDVWEDVTIPADDPEAQAGAVCGRVTSFSEFALGDPAEASLTTIVGDDPDPSAFGAAVTVEVTVDSIEEVWPGTIEVTDGTGGNCTITLVDSSAGSCTFTPLSPGAKTITASYSSGDPEVVAGSEDTEAHLVEAAISTILYTGDTYRASDATTVTLRALIGCAYAPCIEGRVVEFWWDVDADGAVDDPGDILVGTGTTNADGVATDTTTGVAAGVYELIVRTEATADCTDALNTATLVVAGTGDSSNGGGWYSNGGRVSFGYAVQVKTNKRTGAVTVSGQLVWQVNGHWRIKGRVTAYTQVACPYEVTSDTPTAICGYVTGPGDLYSWSDGTGWIFQRTLGYQATVGDGGSATVCNPGTKKRSGSCTTTLKPDYFGMNVLLETVTGEGAPSQLKGGSIWVK